MKKSYQIFLVLLVVAFASSCKKSNNEVTPQQRILGKWRVTAQVSVLAGLTSDDYASLPECERDNYKEFRSGGVYLEDEGATKCDPSDPQETTATWTISSDGRTLSISFFGFFSFNYEILELTDNTLRYRVNDVLGTGLSTTTTLTKIP